MHNKGLATGAVITILFAALVVSAALALLLHPSGGVDVAQTPGVKSPSEQGAGPAATGMPKMVELFAEWCPPCQKMKPILDELQQEYKDKVQFERIDIDKNSEAVKTYKVEAIPVQIFYDKDGKEVAKHVGYYSKEEIKAQFDKMGVTPASSK